MATVALLGDADWSLRRYFAAAPTRQQAKNIYWQDLKDLTRNFWLKPPSEGQLIIYVNGSYGPAEIHVIGMDKPERIEGQPWDGGILDEYANMKPHAWTENVRPALADRKGWCWLVGVPEGRNHYYDMVLDCCEGAIPETIPGDGVYYINHDTGFGYFSWHSGDILDSAEVSAARRELDEKTFKQEFEGSFENFDGLAYSSFGTHNLSSIEYDPMRPVWVGMDFNVDPMTAVFCHPEANSLHQFGEAYLKRSNTYEMIEHMKGLFPVNQVTIFPDSTGKAEKSNASHSDISLLRKAGYTVRAKRSNPFVKDRVNAVNSLMRSADGNTRYYINATNCPFTINDLNRVERLPDGRLDKKQEELGLKHISDALGYLIAFSWPVRASMGGSVSRGA